MMHPSDMHEAVRASVPTARQDLELAFKINAEFDSLHESEREEGRAFTTIEARAMAVAAVLYLDGAIGRPATMEVIAELFSVRS